MSNTFSKSDFPDTIKIHRATFEPPHTERMADQRAKLINVTTAVHPDLNHTGRYAVTHVPTGRQIAWNVDVLDNAIAIAEECPVCHSTDKSEAGAVLGGIAIRFGMIPDDHVQYRLAEARA